MLGICGGTQAEFYDSSCVFPFTYNGVTYDSCTSVGSDKPWCSYDKVYAGNWGYCQEDDQYCSCPLSIGKLQDTVAALQAQVDTLKQYSCENDLEGMMYEGNCYFVTYDQGPQDADLCTRNRTKQGGKLVTITENTLQEKLIEYLLGHPQTVELSRANVWTAGSFNPEETSPDLHSMWQEGYPMTTSTNDYYNDGSWYASYTGVALSVDRMIVPGNGNGQYNADPGDAKEHLCIIEQY